MSRIPQEKIDEIRNSVDIVDVIGRYLSLHRHGRSYKALCPFHDDSDPSLSISQEKQIYMCFVCHNGGNVFTFLQNYLHIEWIEAVKMVAEIGHVDLSAYHLESYSQPVKEENKVYYDMHTEANRIYSYYLNTKSGTLARDYLAKRGFDEELIKRFDVGYAPSKNVLYEAFKHMGYQEIDMEKSGLVIESQRHYDRFNDRVMFALHDEYGRVVGFSGRIYKNGQEGAKYMNSPESDIFIKGQVLYNYHRCKDAVKKEGFVYINEGFMDVIAMSRAHHENCIALMGTALTQGHIRMLKKLTKNIVLCLDGDAPGQAAAYKAAAFLDEQGFDVKLILLPEGRDPDEIYSSEGQDALDAVLKDRLSLIGFMLIYESSKRDLRNYDDRRSLLDAGIKAIAKLTDRIDREHYIEKLSKLTDFSLDIVKEAVNDATLREVPTIDFNRQVNTQFARSFQNVANIVHNKYELAERNLLYYMLNEKAVADLYEAKLGFMYNEEYRVIASYVVDYYRHHVKLDVATLMDIIGPDHPQLVQTLSQVDDLHLPLPSDEKAINDYITIISKNAMKLKKNQLLEQLKDVLDPKARAQIVDEIINLQKENV